MIDISIHALLAESDIRQVDRVSITRRFLSTLSLRRATVWMGGLNCNDGNFYPRSPCGERRQNPGKHYVAFRFLSTLSLRRATACTTTIITCTVSFLSTLSLRRATLRGRAPQPPQGISIHALLAESDMSKRLIELGKLRFLSTLSLRRAT